MNKLDLNLTGATAASNAVTWSIPARVYPRRFRLPLPTPSLRVPATQDNRERLRALRDAELRAWTVSSPNAALRAQVGNSLTSQHSESRLLAGVAGLALVTLILGASSSLDFVANWHQFVSLVNTLLG